MKVYTKIVIDMETMETIHEEYFDYVGPIAHCGDEDEAEGGGGRGGQGLGGDSGEEANAGPEGSGGDMDGASEASNEGDSDVSAGYGIMGYSPDTNVMTDDYISSVDRAISERDRSDRQAARSRGMSQPTQARGYGQAPSMELGIDPAMSTPGSMVNPNQSQYDMINQAAATPVDPNKSSALAEHMTNIFGSKIGQKASKWGGIVGGMLNPAIGVVGKALSGFGQRKGMVDDITQQTGMSRVEAQSFVDNMTQNNARGKGAAYGMDRKGGYFTISAEQGALDHLGTPGGLTHDEFYNEFGYYADDTSGDISAPIKPLTDAGSTPEGNATATIASLRPEILHKYFPEKFKEMYEDDGVADTERRSGGPAPILIKKPVNTARKPAVQRKPVTKDSTSVGGVGGFAGMRKPISRIIQE